MLIRDAKIDDLDRIVSIHLSAFDGYFLSLLGPKFLKNLYMSFLEKETSTLIVAEHESEVSGFIAVAYEPERFFKSIKKSRGLYFLFSAIPALLKNPTLVIKKLLYGVLYRGGGFEKPEGAALISSIGVIPSKSGLGIGKKLLKGAENAALAFGISSTYLTTDKYKNSDVINFYKRNNYIVSSEINQTNNRCMLVLAKDLNLSEVTYE